MSKPKNIIIFLIMITSLFMLTACMPSVHNEKEISEDLISGDYLEIQNAVIENLTIILRQTDKNEKKDLLSCDVIFNDGDIRYKRQYGLAYIYYDQGGWVLRNCEPQNKEEWESEPLVGVNEEYILNNLVQNQSEMLSVSKTSAEGEKIRSPYRYDEFSILDHSTNLDEGVDDILVLCCHTSELLEKEVIYWINYMFDPKTSKWQHMGAKVIEIQKHDFKIEGNWKGTVDFSSGYLGKDLRPIGFTVKLGTDESDLHISDFVYNDYKGFDVTGTIENDIYKITIQSIRDTSGGVPDYIELTPDFENGRLRGTFTHAYKAGGAFGFAVGNRVELEKE